MSRIAPRWFWPVLLAMASAGGARADDGLEVIRVRVPSDDVKRVFPAGTELRVLPAAELETLVERAQARTKPSEPSSVAPRLIRAHHQARLDGDRLVGQTELTFDHPTAGAAIAIAPWSPAIVDPSPNEGVVGATTNGQLLWRPASPTATTAKFSWKLARQSGAAGLSFDLALPNVARCRLMLDLPDGLVPDVGDAIRQGPSSGPTAGRSVWRLDGPAQPWTLRLRPKRLAGDPVDPVWISGFVKIDASDTPVRWDLEASIDPGPNGATRFAIDLDHGLELIDASGPAVAAFRQESIGDAKGTTVSVRLADNTVGPTPVVIRALCRTFGGDNWSIPGFTPRGGIFIGCRTTVRLSGGVAISGSKANRSRQVSPPIADLEFGVAQAGPLVAFESLEPGSPATLSLRQTSSDAWAEFRGTLTVSQSGPRRLESVVTWRSERGHQSLLALDLPPGWTPESARLAGQSEPIPWHGEARPGGGSRVVFRPPATSDSTGAIRVHLMATATGVGTLEGSLDLPRVSPVSVRVWDEVWLMQADPSLSLIPTDARGLAWLDPGTMEAVSSAADSRPDALRLALAWRWTAADGFARIRLDRDPPPTGCDAWTVATIRGDQLTLDYYVMISPSRRGSRALVVAFSSPGVEPPARWQLIGQPGRVIQADSVASASDSVGFPDGVKVKKLSIPADSGTGQLVLHSRTVQRWSGDEVAPLLILPPRDLAQATLLIQVERGLIVECEGPGMEPLDPAWASSSLRQVLGPPSADSGPGTRSGVGRALRYGAATPSAKMHVASFPAATSGGIVEEARLETVPAEQRGSRPLHRLSLRVVPGPDRTMHLTMPASSTVQRVVVEGKPFKPIIDGARLRFELPSVSPSRTGIELELDYLGSVATDANRVWPERPSFDLPCLSFQWEIRTAARETVAAGASLIEVPSPNGNETDLEAEAAALRTLDERVRRFNPEGLTLGGWLARLDGGDVAVVVDRLSLGLAGWGPRTALVPRRSAPAATTAGAVFADLGLRLSAHRSVVVVSANTSVASASGAARAAAWGHDETDRLQSVARWRGEPTPGPGGDRLTQRNENEDGRSTSTEFAASGWPIDHAEVRVVDTTMSRQWSAGLALAIGLGAYFSRHAPRKMQILALSLLCLGIYGLSHVSLGGFGPLVPGFSVGWCAAAGIGVGTILRPRIGGRRRGSVGTSSNLGFRTASSLIAVGIVSAGLAPGLSAGTSSDDPPMNAGSIVVVLPYDPPLAPDVPPKTAILRVIDFDHLQAVADRPQVSAAVEPVLVSATHEIRREGKSDARVISTFGIQLDGPESVAWTFPIVGCREISATLDGRDVPVRLGERASVEISGKREHQLVLSRLIEIKGTPDAATLNIQVPKLATARVVVVGGGEEQVLDVIGARGGSARSEGRVSADLGPRDSIDVQWRDPQPPGPAMPRGSLDTTLLWDVEHAGDRLRVRVSPLSADALSRIALALEPGLTVRSVDHSGSEAATTRTTAQGTVWEMAINPSLQRGQFLNLDLWRPLDGPPASARHLPRLEWLGVANVSGLVGVRRPSRWQGRIGGANDPDSVPDDFFARVWGEFPDSRATFAGAVKFTGIASLEAKLGPPDDRPRVRPAVALAIAPGRLDVAVDFEVVDAGMQPREWDFLIPPDLRILRVEAPGLTEWNRVETGRLRLRFDSVVPTTGASIRFTGTVPVDTDPMESGTVRAESAVPWPSLADATSMPGVLTIAAPAHVTFRLDPATGIAPSTPPIVAPTQFRSAFSVAAGAKPGRLRWSLEPSGVNVRVQSLITLHPQSAEWIASARYAVPWGPCPPIRLRLPTEWADVARVEIGGVAPMVEVDRSDVTTIWTLRPKRAIWGEARVVVRASKTLQSGKDVLVPDLVPLGRPQVDRVESILGFADASGAPTIVEGSAELQPVDGARWDHLDLPWPLASERKVYRIMTEGWSLRLFTSRSARPNGAGARAVLADHECILTPQGTILGRSAFDLDGRPSAFLTVTVPQGCEPLGASVDNEPVRPRSMTSRTLLIPLPEQPAARVVVVWHRRSTTSDERAGQLTPPSLVDPMTPSLLTLSSSLRTDFRVGAGTISTAAAGLEAIRAEVEARSIVEQVSGLDRSSSRERADMLGALVRFELRARSTSRAARAEEAGGARERALTKLAKARSTVSDSLAAAGLDDFGRSAAVRVGRAEREPLPGQTATAELPEPLRIHPLGTSWSFRSETGPLSISWSLPRDPSPTIGRASIPIALGVAAFLLATLATRRLVLSTIGLIAVTLFAAASFGGIALPIGVSLVGLVSGLFRPANISARA